MKNNKLFKITLTILALALCIGAVFAMSISAEEPAAEAKKPEIISQNIKYSEKFQLMYAVDTATVAEGAVTLRVYSVDPALNSDVIPLAEMTVNEPTTDPEILGNLGVDSAYIFTTSAGVSYTAMATNYFAVAEDSEGNKSEVKRYSVAEYFYQRLASADLKPAQERLYKTSLDFGTEVQIAINKMAEDDVNLISKLRYVVVDGGTFDGYSAGLYPTGSSVSPSAQGVSSWNVVNYGIGGETIGVENKVTSYTIPETDGLVAVKFTTGTVFAYPEGYNNLESYADYDALKKGLLCSTNGNFTSELVSEAGHGNALKLSFAAGGDRVGLNSFNSYTESAKAFEASFDLKIASESIAATLNSSIEINIRTANESSQRARLQLFAVVGGKTSTFCVAWGGDGAGSGVTYTGTIETSEWVHVQIVMYDGDENIYIYLNGDTENPIKVKNQTAAMITNNYSISDIATVRVCYGNKMENIDAYIDNVFLGFTKDTAPAASENTN